MQSHKCWTENRFTGSFREEGTWGGHLVQPPAQSWVSGHLSGLSITAQDAASCLPCEGTLLTPAHLSPPQMPLSEAPFEDNDRNRCLTHFRHLLQQEMNHTPAMPGSLHWLQRETRVISSDINIHTGGICLHPDWSYLISFAASPDFAARCHTLGCGCGFVCVTCTCRVPLNVKRVQLKGYIFTTMHQTGGTQKNWYMFQWQIF